MKRVKTVGLTPDQYIALRWLHEFPAGQISQVKLAELMFTDSNNIAGLMKRMEQLNLVRRKANATDNRKKNIFQTKLGSSLFHKGKKLRRNWSRRLFLVFLPMKKNISLNCLLDCRSESMKKEIYQSIIHNLFPHLQTNPISFGISTMHLSI